MKQQKRTGSNVFEMGNANVYADLRHSDPEAMLAKAQLVTKIAEILDERELTLTRAWRSVSRLCLNWRR